MVQVLAGSPEANGFLDRLAAQEPGWEHTNHARPFTMPEPARMHSTQPLQPRCAPRQPETLACFSKRMEHLLIFLTTKGIEGVEILATWLLAPQVHISPNSVTPWPCIAPCEFTVASETYADFQSKPWTLCWL